MEKDKVTINDQVQTENQPAPAVPDSTPQEAPTPEKKPLSDKIKKSFIFFFIFAILIPVALFASNIFSCAKSVSKMELNLISDYNMLSKDYLRIGADNRSDDYRYLTKAVITVTGLRTDDEPHIFSMVEKGETGLNINIYNAGWCDLKDVTIEIDPDIEFYQSLKNPEKFSLDLDTMEHGQIYTLGELTVEDLKDPSKDGKIEILCKVKGENDYYRTTCYYSYSQITGALNSSGKGGNTETYDIEYTIQCDNGVGVYELPIEYSCPSHKFEEIHFGITADRSCYVSYYVGLYANDDLLFETEEKGTYLNISSLSASSSNATTP